jgi:hypothetical protein
MDAERFEITIAGRGQATFNLMATVTPLLGKVNAQEFEGRPPGTVKFEGPRASSTEETGSLHFAYQEHGWNKTFDEATQTWREVQYAHSGKPPYEAADFSPLSAMKI